MVQQNKFRIDWVECLSYNDAKDYSGCVYIFEWAGKPFYIGMVGISTRERRKRFGVRYSPGYRHLIDAPFMHEQSFRLFIGRCVSSEGITDEDIENIEYKLIDELDPQGNRQGGYYPDLTLIHINDVPEYLRR